MALGVALLLVQLLALSSAQAPECSGHGTIVDGVCACSTPLPVSSPPASPPASGWVGAQCNQEVLPLPVSGVETKATLQAGQASCWAATLWGSKVPPNYFVASVTLDASSTSGLKLYGLLAADPVLSGGQGPVPVIYPHTVPGEGAWDYLVQVGPDAGMHAVMQLSGLAVAAVAQQGIYLCASNPADAPAISFTLRAAGHSCPVTLHDNGFISICSSTPEDVRYTSDVCPAGTCACTGVYSRPSAPVDAGLGFESCAAPLLAFPAVGPGEPASVTVNTHPPNTWHFLNVTLGPADKHLALVLSVLSATTGRVSMHVRPLQPPGHLPGTYFARTDYTDFSGDLAESLQLGVGWEGRTLTPGVWYVGVYVFGDAPASYTLTARISACAGLAADCSGRGTCDAATGLCTCAVDAMQTDCSSGNTTLTLGNPLVVAPRTFRADAISLGGLTEALALPTLALKIKASFQLKDALPSWVTSRPFLSITPTPTGPAPSQPPTVFSLVLPAETDKEVELPLDAAQLGGSSSLDIVFYNPWSSPYQLGYTLVAELAARCLDDCSGHGRCDPSGRCACVDGWAGGACDVDLSAFTNGTVPCSAGSRVPVRKEELRATCWAPCDANTGKYDETQCLDFTCDPQAADGQPQRRAGGQDACVTDLCSPGGANVTVTDDSGLFVCARLCLCPADGGVCALEPSCLPDSLRCLDGLIPMAAPDGTMQCVAAPSPGVCEEGSLRLAVPLDGGAAYSVCVCAPPPSLHQPFASHGQQGSRDGSQQKSAVAGSRQLRSASAMAAVETGTGLGPAVTAITRDATASTRDAVGALGQLGGGLRDGSNCAWTAVTNADIDAAGGSVPPSKGVVVCSGGYQVAGADEHGLPLSDGRTLTSGGRCNRVQASKRGVSGGMVFFWCLFSVALAATMVVGGRHALDWYEARRWDLGTSDSEGRGMLGYVRLGMESIFTRGDGGGGGGGSNNRW